MAWERYESIFIAYVFYTRKKIRFCHIGIAIFFEGELKKHPIPTSLSSTPFNVSSSFFICLASIVCELIEEKRVPLKQMA